MLRQKISTRFQFLIGRLDTGKKADEVGYLIEFQFLIGRLDTCIIRILML